MKIIFGKCFIIFVIISNQNLDDYIQSMIIKIVLPKFHTFFIKKRQKSVKIWEHLPKRHYFWIIMKQNKKEISVTIWVKFRLWEKPIFFALYISQNI